MSPQLRFYAYTVGDEDRDALKRQLWRGEAPERKSILVLSQEQQPWLVFSHTVLWVYRCFFFTVNVFFCNPCLGSRFEIQIWNIWNVLPAGWHPTFFLPNKMVGAILVGGLGWLVRRTGNPRLQEAFWGIPCKMQTGRFFDLPEICTRRYPPPPPKKKNILYDERRDFV